MIIFEHANKHRCTIVPMRGIMWFAIVSARREAEICRLEWNDNDLTALSGLVRDAKHPSRANALTRIAARHPRCSTTDSTDVSANLNSVAMNGNHIQKPKQMTSSGRPNAEMLQIGVMHLQPTPGNYFLR